MESSSSHTKKERTTHIISLSLSRNNTNNKREKKKRIKFTVSTRRAHTMSKKTGVGALKLISRRGPLLFIFFRRDGPGQPVLLCAFFSLFVVEPRRIFSFFSLFRSSRIADRALFFLNSLSPLPLSLSLSLVKLLRSQMVQREQGVRVYHPRRWKRGDLRPPVALESGRIPQFTRGAVFPFFD
jgi:hypothetical protein